nr:MAG TPA: hypothetical protein [Caudoviricetes sp.]
MPLFLPALFQAFDAFFVFSIQYKSPFRYNGNNKILSPTFCSQSVYSENFQ